jgi:4'-phosphopantetheinyl transferase
VTAQNLLDPLLRVSTAAVQVRWLACDMITPDELEALASLLDDEERERATRFYFERDRHAYVAAHALTRVMLSTQVPTPPADWRFVCNKHGRPEVVREAGDPPLRFNLSHTHGLVAVAMTLGSDIGIDVEMVRPERFGIELAERAFAESEVALLRATSLARLPEALFTLWTFKEACAKALGGGLSVPFKAFQVSLDPLGVTFSDTFDEDPAHWLLERFAPTSKHVLALALKHPDPAAVTIDAAGFTVSELLSAVPQLGRRPDRTSRH